MGWRPTKGQLDKNQNAIPDQEYHTKDFERALSLEARNKAVATHLTEFLKKTDRYAKTIVFCVDQEHANMMRQELNNLNTDLAAEAHKEGSSYVARVTSDEGDVGGGFLDKFQDPEEKFPVILTTETRLGKMLSGAVKMGVSPAPYLRNANIHDDRIDLRSVYEMDFEQHEKEELKLCAGDILMNEGGYGVGRCAVWEAQISPCYFQKSLHRVRVDQDYILPRFLMHQLIWAREQGLFDDITRATTFQHLTGVRLKRHLITVPPLLEQRRMVAHLDSLQAKVNALRLLQAETAAELDALLPSVLNHAFDGKL